MSNWALEIQQFNVTRVWIRGEAYILADAPRRAPWIGRAAKHLPIPAPLQELLKLLYWQPEELEQRVEEG